MMGSMELEARVQYEHMMHMEHESRVEPVAVAATAVEDEATVAPLGEAVVDSEDSEDAGAAATLLVVAL